MAQLAPVVDSLEAVPEPARQFYKADGAGKYVVDLNGLPPGTASAADLAAANAKIVEFRDNNVKLLGEVEPLRALKTKVGDIDVDAAKTALAAQAELAKKGITKPDDLAAAIKASVDAAVTPLMAQITTITNTATEAQKRADAGTLRAAISDAFTKAGGVPEALEFIVTKAADTFVVEGGGVKAAANKFSTDKPGEPLSLSEWMTQLTKSQTFAFKGSGGGGANPVTGASGKVYPAGTIVLKNPTPQQLGEHSAAIAAGKVRVENDAQA